MTYSMESLAQKVRMLRQRKGWTQKELGIHTGLSESTIFNIERGHVCPRVDAVWMIAKALEIGLDRLCGDQ